MYPLLALFAHNETEIELGVLWRPLLLCVAPTVAIYGIFLLVFERATKAGVLTSLIAVAFFYYGILSRQLDAWGLSETWFFPVWLVLVVGGGVAIVRTRRDLANLTLFLAIATFVLAIVPAVKIASYQADHPSIEASDPHLWPTRLPRPVVSGDARLPDVYVIIPDDYARGDVLRQYFRYRDTHFIHQLERRGFVISSQARSPYSDSEMNIAAALNMDYLSRLPGILGRKSQDVRPVRRLIQDNRASRLLESVGYRYVHLDTDEVTFAAGNPSISSVAAPDSFANLWLQDTVLRHFGGPLGFDQAATNERFRSSIHSMFTVLNEVPNLPGPKFVVFHTLLPHDPYIFGAHGQAVTFAGDLDTRHGAKAGMSFYRRQLQFVGRELLATVDAIQARSKAPPVIVIQADEGYEANPDNLGEAAMRDIRVKGLLALSLPGRNTSTVPRPPNTVNTLRYVFNQYLGTDYKMLRSASYPELDFPYQFEKMRVR